MQSKTGSQKTVARGKRVSLGANIAVCLYHIFQYRCFAQKFEHEPGRIEGDLQSNPHIALTSLPVDDMALGRSIEFAVVPYPEFEQNEQQL